MALGFGAGLKVYHSRGEEGFVHEVVSSIDVRHAQATREEDKVMIMELIEAKVGADEMTNRLRDAVRPQIKQLQTDMLQLWGNE